MQQQGTKLDFTGQDIFIGLDTGNTGWVVCISTEHYEHKTFTQPPDVETLVNYLHRNFPGGSYHCVYEAGYQGFWIHDRLIERGIDCIVVNPADVPTAHKERRRKTNRVDARKLCRNLRSGELHPIYIPSVRAREDRSLLRSRYCFVKKQTRCKNQIKALLGYHGIQIPEEKVASHWSRRYIGYLEQLSLQGSGLETSLKALLQELSSHRQIILQLTRQIRALANEQPHRASVDYLRSVPGISTLSAMIFLTEFVDIARFPTVDDLASYCGLVPDEDSTGDEQTITGITHRRNPYLRALLIECAWVAVRTDPALIMAYNKLSHRMKKQQAIIRIARKLLHRIRFVLKNQQPYKLRIVQSQPELIEH